MKKLKKLAEAADLITDNTDGQQAEQVHKLRQMMKKNALAKKKQETTYVKAKRSKCLWLLGYQTIPTALKNNGVAT